MPRTPRALLGLAAAALLLAAASCATDGPAPTSTAAASAPSAPATAEPPLETTYAALARDGGRLFTLDPSASAVRIYVFRDGRAARLGHNHVLSAPKFQGYAYVPEAGAAQGRFDLSFRLDELEIDVPANRAGLGPAFASVLTADAIAGTREHMLGESNLQADRFPVVRIRSLRIAGESPRYAAQVAMDMHGRTREMLVPLKVEGLPDRLTVSGSFVVRQTDFGVAPYSVAGGLLAVKDEVVVDFTLVGR
jgi:polyisoprenoid-binding protein YceI